MVRIRLHQVCRDVSAPFFPKLSARGGVSPLMKTSIPPSTLLAKVLKGLRSTALLALLSMAGSASFLKAQDFNSSAPAGPGSPGAPGRPPHGGPHILPPRAAEILNLTAEQKQQLKALEDEVRTRIQGILTPAQLEQLRQMRPPRHGKQDGPGGPNAPEASPSPSPVTPLGQTNSQPGQTTN